MRKIIYICVILSMLLSPITLIAGKTWIRNDKTIQYFLKNNYNIVHVHYRGDYRYDQEIIYFRFSDSLKDNNLYRCIINCRTPDNYQAQQCYEMSK